LGPAAGISRLISAFSRYSAGLIPLIFAVGSEDEGEEQPVRTSRLTARARQPDLSTILLMGGDPVSSLDAGRDI
jgi:hypothetical protein